MIKYLVYINIFFSICFTQDYFNVSIAETGESTLFIFQDLDLEIGDEIGLFDSSGVLDSSGSLGEILVGSGVWIGSQIEIIAIGSVDLSDFGGPILPGSVQGNPLVLKIWNSFDNQEYEMNYYISAGSGTFNGLFTVINAISLASECDTANCGCMDITACNYNPNANLDDGSCSYPDELIGECDCNGNTFDCLGQCGGMAELDLCGVCGGPGAVYECGCYDIQEGECDCVGNTLDQCNVCGGDNSFCSDCNGVPNGGSILDECGICDGDNSSCSDCLGEPNGDAEVDNCGICDGENSLCSNPEAVISFYNVGGVNLTNIDVDILNAGSLCLSNVILSSTSGNNLDLFTGECINVNEGLFSIPIYLKNTQPIAGFQFNVEGGEILNVYGGEAETQDFLVSSSSSLVLAFSLVGSNIPPSGDFYGCTDELACNYASNATIDNSLCTYAEEGFDCDGNCLNEDCFGDCNGNAELDECGVCEGPGATFQCENGLFVCNESECFDDGDEDGGGDGGGDNGQECGENEILDCNGLCSPLAWLGDGYCDESTTNYNCLDLSYDMGDCDIDFTYHVMPLILANCTGYCHNGPSAYQGGLDLSSYSGLMSGGNSGPSVIPYYPDYSLIIQKLNGTAPGGQMPDNGSPLPENYINTIYHWIAQGALSSDFNPNEDCDTEGEIQDCDGLCVNSNLLGNNNCDDGEEGEANFNCAQFIFDDADCPVGVLEFGDYTYNVNNGSGTIDILMNCEFPVSNFEIAISGLDIAGLFGGSAEQSNFDLNFTDSIILGNSTNSLYISENSGLLTTVNFGSIDLEAIEICFSGSTITTSAGYEYNAILGDCISIDLLGDSVFIPNQITINKIFPNPFNPLTTISYNVPNNQNIIINIYDLNGKFVDNLVDKFHRTGKHSINWNANLLSTGIYIVELKGENHFVTKKITLIK